MTGGLGMREVMGGRQGRGLRSRISEGGEVASLFLSNRVRGSVSLSHGGAALVKDSIFQVD